ncbi:MAG: ABC transporter substrate-binding protein [Chloroflexi bacterium]|nr:ABC transporter substrate-binding protein [Chloroflexota bacterium]
MKKSIYLLLASVLTASMLLAACAAPKPAATPAPSPTVTTTPTVVPKASPTPTAKPAETPQYGGVLKFGYSSGPSSIIPWRNTIGATGSVLRASYDTLLRVDEKGELAPWLATDWKFSSDFKSLTLTLRKGVKFHDGTDFNAAAVKFSLELRKAAKLGDYESVESIDVVDDNTVRLNLSQFQNTLLISLWHIAGMTTSSTAYQKLGAAAAELQPVGTGPFKFVSWQPSVLVKYERFDGYWQKGKPYLDGWNVVPFADGLTQSFAIEKGEIHLGISVTPERAAEMVKAGFRALDTGLETVNVLFPDTANTSSPFANKKVREAMEYAIDREAIVKTLGRGLAEPLAQLVNAGGYAHVPGLGRTYDPAKAKQLLAEAGYSNGFSTTLWMNTSVSDDDVAIATYLKAVGIDAKLQAVPLVALNQLIQGGWQNGLIKRALRLQPDWLAYMYPMLSTTSIQNKSMLRPPGLQELLDQALAARDTVAKKTASQQVIRKIFDEAMVIPLQVSRRSVIYDRTVRNLEWFDPWGATKVWSPADTWLGK